MDVVWRVVVWRMACIRCKWCRLSESNRRPTAYKAVALPTELSRRARILAPGVQARAVDRRVRRRGDVAGDARRIEACAGADMDPSLGIDAERRDLREPEIG